MHQIFDIVVLTQTSTSLWGEYCRPSNDTTANKLNTYYLIGQFLYYFFLNTNHSVAKYWWYIYVQGVSDCKQLIQMIQDTILNLK